MLTDAYPEAIQTKDRRQRTPLHFALSNAGRKTVPSAVRLLLSLNKDIVNSMDGGPLPLRVLCEYTQTIKGDDEKRDEKRESVFRCLEHLLGATPDPTADFLTTLQSLPDWLSERAVVMPSVQILLNEKIARRFPTGVLIMDFYMQLMIIIQYSFAVVESIELRFDDDPDNDASINVSTFIPLYLGAAYFFIREVIQIVSLISLKSFNIWLYDPSNYLNVAYVFLVTYWTVRMEFGSGDKDAFRIGAAVSAVALWVKLLAYLRNMLIDFAVFVGGVFYVVRRLAAFLTALMVILIAFAQVRCSIVIFYDRDCLRCALLHLYSPDTITLLLLPNYEQMFNTIFQQSDYCTQQPNNFIEDEFILEMTKCSENMVHPYCTFWESYLNVYTMLLGDVDETNFKDSPVATALFVLFMFLCVILLANVLIAIVTDSYKVIQDQRAAIVFWTNRLDFVAEMDAIANGPWKSRLKKSFGFGADSTDSSGRTEQAGKELWIKLKEFFEDDIDAGPLSIDFYLYNLLRLVVAIFVIPCWLLLGVITLGWCWPPQVREAVFTSTVFKHSSDSEKEDELRKTQVKKLQEEVLGLKDELLQELALDRTQVVQMKSQVAERKLEISNEMKDIKKIVAILFERQSRFTS